MRVCVILDHNYDVVATVRAGRDEDFSDELDQSMPEETERMVWAMLGGDDEYGWIVVTGVASLDEAAETARQIARGPGGTW